MTRCLETRRTPEGFKRRRYINDDGARFSTIEVPMELWTYMNSAGRARNRAIEIARTMERKSTRARAESLLATDKPLSVAHALGLPERTVQRWAKALKEKQR